MASPIGLLLGGDGWAANAGLGLIPHGQSQKKRKLTSESSAQGLTGKAEEQTNSKTTVATDCATECSGGKKKRRKTKWNVEPGLSIVRNAIYMYRNGVCNSVQIERLLQVPARTLRRYVNESMDKSCKLFYMPETPHERRGRELQEAGQRHGLYSHKSFEAAMRYARRPEGSATGSEAMAAAAPAVAAQQAMTAAATAAVATASAAAATAAAASTASPCAMQSIFSLPSPPTPRASRVPVSKQHSLLDPQASAGSSSSSSNVFDLDGALDVLNQLGSVVPATATDGHAAALEDLDFGMLDYFSELSSGGGQVHSSLSPLDGAAASQRGQASCASSIGDTLSQIVALPLSPRLETPRLIPAVSLDVDPMRNQAETDALQQSAWKLQRRQLVEPSLW